MSSGVTVLGVTHGNLQFECGRDLVNFLLVPACVELREKDLNLETKLDNTVKLVSNITFTQRTPVLSDHLN